MKILKRVEPFIRYIISFENNIAYEFASSHRVSNHSNNLVWYIKTNRRELHSSGETLCMAFRDKIEYKNLKALGDN